MPKHTHVRTAEQIENYRKAQLGKKQSPETIAKRIAASAVTRVTNPKPPRKASPQQLASLAAYYTNQKDLPDVACTNDCGRTDIRPLGLSRHLKRCVGFKCKITECSRLDQGSYDLCGFHYGILKAVRKHGLTIETYLEIYSKQNGCCAICSREGLHRGHGVGNEDKNKVLCIDHDHATGEVRGLICHPCNVSLGLMQDNPSRLRAAADYLERFNGQLP